MLKGLGVYLEGNVVDMAVGIVNRTTLELW
jgi:large-conductance mechanosensitive channel